VKSSLAYRSTYIRATPNPISHRSAQRWEQTTGLPVYRQGAGPRGRVYAYSDELLERLESGRARRAQFGFALVPGWLVSASPTTWNFLLR